MGEASINRGDQTIGGLQGVSDTDKRADFVIYFRFATLKFFAFVFSFCSKLNII